MKKYISIILFLTFILNSCGKTEEIIETEVKPKYVKTQIVEKKPFVENIKLAGKVTSSQETTISPLSSGIIKTINVNVGDKVKTGDILAIIDTQSNLTNISLNNAQNVYNNTLNVYSTTKEALEKNLESARLQLDNAKIAKENVYKSTEKQLELAQAQVDTVLKQKDNTQATVKSSISLVEENLESAKLSLKNFNKNYDETIKGLDSKKESLLNNIKVSIVGSLVTIDSSITSVDTILGVTDLNKNLNNSYEIYLSAKNTSLKTEAEQIFLENNSTFQTLKAEYRDDFSQDELIKYYSKLLSLSEKMVTLFDKMVLVLENSITSSNLTDGMLTGLKTSIKTYQGQIISLKGQIVTLTNSLKDLENTISSTITNLNTQKSTIEQSIIVVQATLDNTKTSTTTSIDNITSSENTTNIQLENTINSIKSARETADNGVKIAENQYASAKANYNSSLAGVKSQLDNATGQKNSLNQQINNAYIKAPFNGVITSKNIEVGSSVSQASQVFSIANGSKKIIKMDVNGDNIKYLQLKKEVKIEKNSKTATGYISVLGSSSNDFTKMYKVEISFNNKDFNDYVVLGDFVDIYTQKEIKNENFIVIPFSSMIVGSNDSYSVFVIGEDNLVEEKIISIGSSNSSEVIVTDGLKIGNKIVIEGALNISIGDKVEEM